MPSTMETNANSRLVWEPLFPRVSALVGPLSSLSDPPELVVLRSTPPTLETHGIQGIFWGQKHQDIMEFGGGAEDTYVESTH